jgi:hypothetical protein
MKGYDRTSALGADFFILKEVIHMDFSVNPDKIKNLFYQQMKNVTLRSIEDSFDVQFSGKSL